MEKIKKIESNFKSVDFMREVRSELNDLYLKDKSKYLFEVKKAMTDFTKNQEKEDNSKN